MEDKKYSKLKAAFEATQPQVPADFTERVMKRIESTTVSFSVQTPSGVAVSDHCCRCRQHSSAADVPLSVQSRRNSG